MATFTVYKGRASSWRWQLKANNGKIIADSGGATASLLGDVVLYLGNAVTRMR